jgi:hypothetical protein
MSHPRAMQMLPASLQARIAVQNCASTLQRNSHLLADCDAQFLARFTMKLQEVFLMPGESVLKQGDIAREMSFVVKGTLVVLDEKDTLVQLVSGEGTASSVIGSVSFLMGRCTFSVNSMPEVPNLATG